MKIKNLAALFGIALLCGTLVASAEPPIEKNSDVNDVGAVGSIKGSEVLLTLLEKDSFTKITNASLFMRSATDPNAARLNAIDFRQGTESCQEMSGFGFAVTESTAINLLRLPLEKRKQAIETLVSREKGAGFNYIVLPLSSTDFNDTKRGDFSVCDCAGQPDPAKSCFNPSRLKDKIQILQEMKAVNPELKLLLKPWTTPPYMKVQSSISQPNPYSGGKFDPKWTESYAACLADSVKYVEGQGLKVQSIAAQNEPGLDLWYPSVVVDDVDHAKILDRVSSLLRASGLSPQMVIRSDNFVAAPGAKTTLENMKPAPRRPVFAAHCYSSDPWSSKVLLKPGQERFCSTEANGEIEYMMGECTASGIPDKKGDFDWWMRERVFTDIDMGASTILAWNGVLDDNYGPRNNGCEKCRGLLTTAFAPKHAQMAINPEYQALAHVSRYVQPRAKRLITEPKSKVQVLAFLNPDGSQVALLYNQESQSQELNLVTRKGQVMNLAVPERSAMTIKIPAGN